MSSSRGAEQSDSESTLTVYSLWREWNPLITEFEVRFVAGNRRREQIDWNERISNAIKDEPGCDAWVEELIQLVLREEQGTPPRTLSADEKLQFFIQFFWILYQGTKQGRDRAAQNDVVKYVRAKSKKLSFDTSPTDLSRFWDDSWNDKKRKADAERVDLKDGIDLHDGPRQSPHSAGWPKDPTMVMPVPPVITMSSPLQVTRMSRFNVDTPALAGLPEEYDGKPPKRRKTSVAPTEDVSDTNLTKDERICETYSPTHFFGVASIRESPQDPEHDEHARTPGANRSSSQKRVRKSNSSKIKRSRKKAPRKLEKLPPNEEGHIQVLATDAFFSPTVEPADTEIASADNDWTMKSEEPTSSRGPTIGEDSQFFEVQDHQIPGTEPQDAGPLEDSITRLQGHIQVGRSASAKPRFISPGPNDSSGPRPILTLNPPIWAQSRQELCESVDFFKSYQGGVYFTKGFAKGYLLGGFPALRDLFHENGKLIVSHGGGKASSKLVEAADQSMVDHSVSALLNTFRTKQPIVLIADDKYAEFPFDLAASGKEGHAYIVLGQYMIRDFWAEQQPADNSTGTAVRYRFAFQWCGREEPWWHLPPENAIQGPKQTFQAHQLPSSSLQCFTCGLESRFIYKQGWMCLHPACTNFFTLSTGPATTDKLEYADSFLELSALPEACLPAIAPAQPLSTAGNGISTTPLFYRGWHCISCGRLSSRVKWEHWECPSCEKKLTVSGTIRSHKEFWGMKAAEFEHFLLEPRSAVSQSGMRSRNGIGFFTFDLPNKWGRIHLIVGTVVNNSKCNSIFQDYQVAANSGLLPFRRFPLRSHQCRGTLLTNYFSQNCGAPYQYVGGADRTLPFEDCPHCVISARELIEERASIVLSERPHFNELLNAAYMEKQSMSFHTDNEKGLGPIVSSLSMGSPALMKFRSIHDKKIALILVLRHGDVVVMEGCGVQDNYQHAVFPTGFRIAATARLIGEENSTVRR